VSGPVVDPAQARATWPLVVEYVEATYATRSEYSPAAVAAVVTDMHARHEFGMRHYGVPLAVGVKPDNLAEAYAEALDLAVYLYTDAEAHQADTIDRYVVMSLFERTVTLVLDIRVAMLHRKGVDR